MSFISTGSLANTIGTLDVTSVQAVCAVGLFEVIACLVVVLGVVVVTEVVVDLTIIGGDVCFASNVDNISDNLDVVVLSVLLIRSGGSRSGNMDESMLLSKISWVCSTRQQDPK